MVTISLVGALGAFLLLVGYVLSRPLVTPR